MLDEVLTAIVFIPDDFITANQRCDQVDITVFVDVGPIYGIMSKTSVIDNALKGKGARTGPRNNNELQAERNDNFTTRAIHTLVTVTVIISPYLKSLSGLNPIDMVPPPLNTPEINPVCVPDTTMLLEFTVGAEITAGKLSVILEFTATLLAFCTGVEVDRQWCWEPEGQKTQRYY